MKKRNFFKLILKSSCVVFVMPIISLVSFDNIKKNIYKKKFYKIWMLDINDN